MIVAVVPFGWSVNWRVVDLEGAVKFWPLFFLDNGTGVIGAGVGGFFFGGVLERLVIWRTVPGVRVCLRWRITLAAAVATGVAAGVELGGGWVLVADFDFNIFLLVLLVSLSNKRKTGWDFVVFLLDKLAVVVVDAWLWLFGGGAGDVLSLVNKLVLLESEAAAEGLVANVAFEGFHFRVCFLVTLQVRDLAEGASADIAFVRLLPCMNSNVFFQMLGESESLVAVMAAKRPLVSVDHLVAMEVFQEGKSTSACFALVGASFVTVSVVGKFVLFELVFGLEKASTALALVLVVGAVTGLVLLQAGQVGVAPTANVAHVGFVRDDPFWLVEWGLLRLLALLLLLESHVHALELEVVHARKWHLCALLLEKARLSEKIQQGHSLCFLCFRVSVCVVSFFSFL
jgi:hypothetical protein